jgi:hypothetical protein
VPEVAVLEAECMLTLGRYAGAVAAANAVSPSSPLTAARANEIAGDASLRLQTPIEALDHFIAALIFDVDSDPARAGLKQLCETDQVTVRRLRAGLDRLYRRASRPDVVLDIAAELAGIEGFEDLSEWVQVRRDLQAAEQ